VVSEGAKSGSGRSRAAPGFALARRSSPTPVLPRALPQLRSGVGRRIDPGSRRLRAEVARVCRRRFLRPADNLSRFEPDQFAMMPPASVLVEAKPTTSSTDMDAFLSRAHRVRPAQGDQGPIRKLHDRE
jgi:hypothetical protein